MRHSALRLEQLRSSLESSASILLVISTPHRGLQTSESIEILLKIKANASTPAPKSRIDRGMSGPRPPRGPPPRNERFFRRDRSRSREADYRKVSSMLCRMVRYEENRPQGL